VVVRGRPVPAEYYRVEDLVWVWGGRKLPVKTSRFRVVIGVWSAAVYGVLQDGLSDRQIRKAIRTLYPFP
jgi:hypothetical protein